MGSPATIHGRRLGGCGIVLNRAWLVQGDHIRILGQLFISEQIVSETVATTVRLTDVQTPTATILLAVLSIYALDFAINAGKSNDVKPWQQTADNVTVQWSCRSLIIDTLPIQKQQAGSAWASVMVAVGNLLCYGAGAIDLELVFGTMLGDTQFKRLTIVAGMALGIAVGVTCYAVTERVRLADL
jgi:hypothetical protein